MDDMDRHSNPQVQEQPREPASRRDRRGHRVSFWLAIVFGVGGALSLGLNMLLLLGLAAVVGGGAPSQQEFTVQEVEPGSGQRRLLLVELHDVISEQADEHLFGIGPSPVAAVSDRLDAAAEDLGIAGVLLSIDSPGGGVTASDKLYHAVQRYRERTGNPVLVHMGAVCASGGYYVAMAADRVLASPTTITGSIGVIMALIDAEGLLEDKLGLQAVTIKSGPHKDMTSPWRDMTPAERAMLQELVDTMYQRFVDIVLRKRVASEALAGLDPDAAAAQLRNLADGRIMHAEQALEGGLIDGIAYRDEVLEELRALSGAGAAPLVRYRRLGGGLAGLLQARDPVADLDAAVRGALQPSLEYRWRPGH
ncbi:MAG: signal peptide peptidase SppA [Planctomycetota bacterium]